MAWNNFLWISILFMLVFIKNSLQTQFEFYKKDFKSFGRRVWSCQARLLNCETSIDSIITTSIGQSIITSNNKAMAINLFNNDYDPHKSKKKDQHYHCHCGREFTTFHELNTHKRSCNILDIPNIKEILTTPINFNENFIESVPKITTDDLPKNILKAGIKLPKSKRNWDIANEDFKSLLNTDTSDLETGISLMQSTIYNYFAQNYRKLEAKNTALEQKYKNCTKDQLKKGLKQLKSHTTHQIKIKYVSKILRSQYKKIEQEDIDHQTHYTENFWKYCKNTFEPQGNAIKLDFSEDTCYKYF